MADHGQGVCGTLVHAYPLNDFIPGAKLPDALGIGEALFGLAYFLNAFVMLFWIYQQKRRALKGVDGAALHVIFPVYIPFMYMSFLSDILVGALVLFMPVNYNGPNDWLMASVAGFIYGLQHFVLEGIAFTMMQYGCGFQAAYKAALFSFMFAVFTFLDQLVVRRYEATAYSYGADLFWNTTLFFFYLGLWLLPETYLFRRPSILFYAKFWAVFRLIYIIGNTIETFWSKQTYGVGFCAFVFGNMAIFVIFKPYVIYHTLLADSMWWQGLGKNIISESMSEDSRSSLGSKSGSGSGSDPDQAPAGPSDPNTHDADAPLLDSLERNQHDINIEQHTVVTEEGFAAGGLGVSFFQSPLPSVKSVISTSESNEAKRKKSRSASLSFWGNRPSRKYRALSNPLLGMEVGFNEAQELAKEVDNLRSSGEVRLLNFAYLELKKSAPVLGYGSYSKVYAGEFRGRPVAIKMLFTPDLNPEVIKRCCNEAQILSKIRHENIVMIYGVSVLPPSVCIVLEKCEYGSLADVLRGSQKIGGLSKGPKKKSPLPLSKADRMFLALGCCQGVAAIHKHSANMVHRDIKSLNFLVDSQLIVKIADLELGASNDPTADKHVEMQGDKIAAPIAVGAFRSSMMMSSWQAPEVISGGQYTQASDVYSLAMVLWEIIAPTVTYTNSPSHSYHTSHSSSSFSPNTRTSTTAALMAALHVTSAPESNDTMFAQLPFGDCKSQNEVRAKILANERPLIPKGVNGRYADLIERGWQRDSTLRPSAEEATKIVKQCWLDSLHRLIRETPFLVDFAVVDEAYLMHRQGMNSSSDNNSFQPSLSLSKNYFLSSKSTDVQIPTRTSPPSPKLLSALSIMRQEERWLLLEDEGIFVVLSPSPPHLILWATKSWVKATGHLLNDVLAQPINFLEGPLSDKTALQQLLSCASTGNPKHSVFTHYRKGGKTFIDSVHAMPVFVSNAVPIRASTSSNNLANYIHASAINNFQSANMSQRQGRIYTNHTNQLSKISDHSNSSRSSQNSVDRVSISDIESNSKPTSNESVANTNLVDIDIHSDGGTDSQPVIAGSDSDMKASMSVPIDPAGGNSHATPNQGKKSLGGSPSGISSFLNSFRQSHRDANESNAIHGYARESSIYSINTRDSSQVTSTGRTTTSSILTSMRGSSSTMSSNVSNDTEANSSKVAYIVLQFSIFKDHIKS